MHFGSRHLFSDVDLQLYPGERYGLTGANGSGKTTFLRIVAGHEQPTSGTLSIGRGLKVGFLEQDQHQFDAVPIIDAVLQADEELWNALSRIRELKHLTTLDDQQGHELAELDDILLHNNGYRADADVRKLLSGLGIDPEKHDKPVSELSGGYKIRVLLARLLFRQPDIMLLDEPSNHLDLPSIRWLERYLNYDFRGLLLVVSHDCAFLEDVTTAILDFDYESIQLYPMSYGKMLQYKQQAHDQLEREQANQQKSIEQQERFIERFKAKASKARQAQSRKKQLDKIERIEVKQSTRCYPKFAFRSHEPSNKLVLEVEGLSKRFPTQELWTNVDFSLLRGERLGIIGINGIGKSTLMHVLMGKEAPSSGKFEWGSRCKLGYFAQSHKEIMQGTESVVTWVEQRHPQQNPKNVRSALGRVTLSGEDGTKPITALSGGEASKVLFADLMLSAPNVLLLDEPTNHLDIESIEALIDALKKFDGTVIVVSHDRFFLEGVATRILALEQGHYDDHHGDLNSFLGKYGDEVFYKRVNRAVDPVIEAVEVVAIPNGANSAAARQAYMQSLRRVRAQVEKAEQTILALEKSMGDLSEQQSDPDLYGPSNRDKLERLLKQKATLKEDLQRATAAWETLLEQAADLEAKVADLDKK